MQRLSPTWCRGQPRGESLDCAGALGRTVYRITRTAPAAWKATELQLGLRGSAAAQIQTYVSMPATLRLALIGGGLITESAHLPAAIACGEFEVVALVDPVRQRIERLASAFGIEPLLAGTVGEIAGQVDAAVIATPNDTHAAIAMECLEAGIPVLVEKPLASSVPDGRALIEAAVRKSLVVAPGYVTRFRRNLQWLRELLSRGHFGSLRRFVHQFGTPGGWAPLSAYNLRRSSAGGGVLVVTGTHFLDRMLWFWGVPDEVEYRDDARGGPEANCVARFRYHGAAAFEGEARYSKTTALPAGLVIEAEKGTCVLADNDDADIHFYPHESSGLVQILRREKEASASQSTFAAQLSAFAAACRGEVAFPVSPEQAVQSLELIERLYACRQPLAEDWYRASP